MIQLAGASALGALLPPHLARAAPLPEEDLQRLSHGELVKLPLDVDLPQGGYFGGVSYAVIRAPTRAVNDVLADPESYAHVIPRTLETRVVERRGRDTSVYFRQGGKAGSAAYVLLVRREAPGQAGLIRFWLDPEQPHEIADLWGYFRVEPWEGGSSLLTYGALVRLDFGMVKLLFSETIRRVALGTPIQVREFVEGREK